MIMHEETCQKMHLIHALVTIHAIPDMMHKDKVLQKQHRSHYNQQRLNV